MPIPAIDKPSIFVTSSGRTGTLFFGTLLQQIIADCSSFHEPDVMTKNDWTQWSFVIRHFGLMPSTIGKVTSQGSLRAVGVGRVRGIMTDDEAIQFLRRVRNRFIAATKHRFYCEANQQLLLLTDLLPVAFPNSHTIYIIRDPRDWVRSCMNIPQGWYTWRDFTLWFPNGKLRPEYVPGDSAKSTWATMSRFEKLCWAWNAYNSFALQKLSSSPVVSIHRFEDLFQSADGEAQISDLLSRVTRFPSGSQATWNLPAGVTRHKIHAATKDHSDWTQWSPAWCRALHHHCGSLMQQFGYGTEPEWLDKCVLSGERQCV